MLPRGSTMAMKLGSKSSEGFQCQGQAWFCTTTGLPSDVVIEVDGMSFHFHKFPLMAKSATLARLITEAEDEHGGSCVIHLSEIPGGSESFELAAKFCYGFRLELTASNVVPLRCAAEFLGMSEDLCEGNLAAVTEGFLNQRVLRSWRDSVRALASCERVLVDADGLGLVKRCVDSIASKACSDPSLFGWPLRDSHPGMAASPGGSVLWNGISTGARPAASTSAWWYDDVASALSPTIFQRLVAAMESRGIKAEIVAGAVVAYARRHLPGLDRSRRRGGGGGGSAGRGAAAVSTLSEQRELLEEVEALLPMQKGVTPTSFLLRLLELGMILGASNECKASLEARIGMQLNTASVDDLLLPSYSEDVETLYDIDAVKRMVEHFLSVDGGGGNAVEEEDEEDEGAPPALAVVGQLLDEYLAEVAADFSLKPAKFESLADALPEYARKCDDGLYRAIDVYFSTHRWLTEEDKEKLCKLMNCNKLSFEACKHATTNERLPLRVVVQVLFFEQLQLRSAIAGCFQDVHYRQRLNEGLTGETRRDSVPGRREGLASVLRENQVMRVDMDRMRSRVVELERECTQMREQIEKLGIRGGSTAAAASGGAGKSPFSLARKFGCRSKLYALAPDCSQAGKLSKAVADDGMVFDKRSKQQEYQRHQMQRRHRRSHSLV